MRTFQPQHMSNICPALESAETHVLQISLAIRRFFTAFSAGRMPKTLLEILQESEP